MSRVGFWAWAAAEPERVAIVEVDGREVTFGELAARVHRTARGLQQRGLRRGDVIATVLRNRSECFEAFLAALNCGWYYVPVNHHATADDIRYIVGNSEARAVLVDPEFADRAREALEASALPAAMRLVAGEAAGFVPLATLREGQSADRPDFGVAGQVMQYTSGTTGRPKGVRRPLDPRKSADDVILGMAWLLSVFGVKPGAGAHLVTAPMYHSAVHSLSHAALHFGQKIVLMEKWTAESCLELIARHRITTSHMVATHFHRLLQLPDAVRAAAEVCSLTHIIHGAVPTPVSTKRRMLEWWGPVIYEYYGSSEVGGTSVGPQEWLARPGTVGRPFPISEVHILDEQGQELPAGQVGQIWMRQGDQDFSYFKDPAKTERSTRGRLIHVGDYGYVDADGYLFLSGRDAEVIISGGVNIYPAAVEARLLEHPAVHDCGVVGVPNDEFGEEVRAVVVLNAPHAAGPDTERLLLEHCRAGLSHVVCPRSVDFVDALPRDPSGKLVKPVLRARYWAGRERQI